MKKIIVLFFIGLCVAACTRQIRTGVYLINSPLVGDQNEAKELLGGQALNVELVSWFSKPNGGIAVNVDPYVNKAYDGKNWDVRTAYHEGATELGKLLNTDISVTLDADLQKDGVKFLNDANLSSNIKNNDKVDYKITNVYESIRIGDHEIKDVCDNYPSPSKAFVTKVYLVDAEATYTTVRALDASEKAKLGLLVNQKITVTVKGDNQIVLKFHNAWAAVSVQERKCK